VQSESHRKRVRHFDTDGTARFLTCSTYRRLPLFTDIADPAVAEIVLNSIRRAAGDHEWDVLAWVIMPEHVHLVLHPGSPKNRPRLSAFLKAFKQTSSFRIKQGLRRTSPEVLDALTIQERPGKTVFRFWQEGSGFDRNLLSPEAVRNAINYTHANPVRRGLCQNPDQWAWSSIHQWLRPSEPIPDWMPRVNHARLRS